MALASSHYLKIERENSQIDGESEGRDHEGQIDVKGWNWDVNDKAAETAAAGKSASAGAAPGQASASARGTVATGIEPSLFTFTKPVDRSTIALMQAMNTGEVLKRATFELLEQMEAVDNPFRFLVVLEKVTVVSYKLGGRASEHRVDLDETWEFNYTTISFDYKSAGGLSATFKRTPGSTKQGASKSGPDIDQLQKQLSKLQQDAAANKGAGVKDKRG